MPNRFKRFGVQRFYKESTCDKSMIPNWVFEPDAFRSGCKGCGRVLKDVIVSICYLLLEFPEQMLRRFTDFAVRTVGILLTMGEKYFKPIGWVIFFSRLWELPECLIAYYGGRFFLPCQSSCLWLRLFEQILIKKCQLRSSILFLRANTIDSRRFERHHFFLWNSEQILTRPRHCWLPFYQMDRLQFFVLILRMPNCLFCGNLPVLCSLRGCLESFEVSNSGSDAWKTYSGCTLAELTAILRFSSKSDVFQIW